MALIIYEVECGHKVSGPATLVSGTLYCPWHHERRAITDVVVMEWRAKCYSCRYARWAGMSEPNAGLFANAHDRHNPHHNVVTQKRPNPLAVSTKEKFDAWQVRA